MNDYNRYRFSTAKDVIGDVLKSEYEINFCRSPLLSGAGSPEAGMERVLLSDMTTVSVFEFDNFLHYVPLGILPTD
jgi:hypothetical protein